MNSKFFFWRSLKTRVTLFTLAIFIVSIWALSFYTTRMLRDDMQRVLGEQQFQTASLAASEINDHLIDQIAALELVAKEIDAHLIGSPAELQARLAQRTILSIMFNSGTWVSGQDGIVIASNLPVLIGTNYADREYLKTVLKGSKSTISKPITGKVLKDPIFVVAVPIRDASGKVIGAMAGVTDLSIRNFLDRAAKSHFGNTGGVSLNAPQHRLIITATDKTRIMQPLPPPGVNKMLDRYMQGYEGYGVSVNSRGVEELTAAKGIPIAGWFMGVVIPTAEAFAPVYDMQQRLLWATILLTLLASGLTWWILKRQLSPLIATADAMTALSNTNRVPPLLPVTSQDEIGQLTSSFNRLIETWMQREDALRENEANLAITLNSIGDAVMATDPTGRVTRMNSTAERLSGWTLADARDRPLADVFRIVNAATREPVADPVQLVMAQGQVVGLANHTVLLAKDGREYQIADSAAPIRNASGEIVGVVLVFSDVTERYRAEEALRAGERRFRSYFDQPMVGIAITSPKKGWIEANEHLCKMLGYSNDELVRLTWAEFTHPDDLGADLIQFERVLRGEIDGYALDKRFIRKDQSVIPVFLSVRCVREVDGSVDYFVALLQDITARKQAEKALRQSETHYRTMFASAPEGVWMIGPDRCTTEVNQRMCDLVGYTREEFLGRNPVEFVDEENSRIFEEKARIVPNRQTRTYEIALRHRDGHNILTEFRATNLFNEDGSVMGVLAFVADLTVRKQAEAKLHLAANVFSHAREGIIITDASGTIIDVNEAFTRITGYGREEALGQNPRILKSGRQDKAFYEVIWRDLTEQGHWSGEIWNRRKDGEVYAELLTISSVRDAAGAVQQYAGLFSDITAMMQHQSQLEHIAHFDALTSLPNRVLLADRLQQAKAQALRRNQQLAVAFLDLDGFKTINDQHGHDAGDQVLVKLAQRMKQALREGDSLARLGGDEFVAVLIDLEDQAASLPMLSRLLLACAQSVQVGDLSLHVSASLGVTFYPQAQDIDADQLIRQADQAMYQAKLAGKNRYHIFDATQDSSIRGHHESVERIRLALEMSEFVLYYQPKVNMRSGQIIGAEALIRWQHPEKGLLLPAVFLPVIEDHALAVFIGEWVIDTALTQIELWRSAGLDMKVSVNIGARQLQQSDFVERLKSILAKHPQVDPTSLELEVLETSALEDFAQVSQVIEDCAQIGVTFALDDFGTGYSSLTYLKRLRVQVLKIDQSFVGDMLEDSADWAILQGIIGMAAAFKQDVIAEGVETIEHGSLLLQLGCILAQGYGIARPMPAAQMPKWATEWQPDAAWDSVWDNIKAGKGLNGIERRSKANERRIVTE
jgi:diguanylate cyclase (GGDEF)-like protein/PAS domain S-box-containing protein